jgi:hypothetical protein
MSMHVAGITNKSSSATSAFEVDAFDGPAGASWVVITDTNRLGLDFRRCVFFV